MSELKTNGENLDRLFRLVKSTSVLIKAGKSSYFFLMFFSQFTHLKAFLHCFWARRWYFETGPDWYVNCISCQKIVFLSQDTLQAEFIYYFFFMQDETHQMYHKDLDRCLAVHPENQSLLTRDCNDNDLFQKWAWKELKPYWAKKQ